MMWKICDCGVKALVLMEHSGGLRGLCLQENRRRVAYIEVRGQIS